MSPDAYFPKIVAFHQENKRMPSYREIMELLGFKSKNAVYKLVKKLINLGFLKKDPSGLLIPTHHFYEIPWFGTVVAGYPNPAEQELFDFLSLDDYVINKKKATYMLRVQGDSMVEAGILPGDIVLVERRETAKPGEIVIAQVDGEWTMKTFYKRGKAIILEAANKRYKTIIPKEALQIAAVVCGLVRKY